MGRARKLEPAPGRVVSVVPPDPLVVLTRAYNEAVVELGRVRAENADLRVRVERWERLRAAVREVDLEGVA